MNTTQLEWKFSFFLGLCPAVLSRVVAREHLDGTEVSLGSAKAVVFSTVKQIRHGKRIFLSGKDLSYTLEGKKRSTDSGVPSLFVLNRRQLVGGEGQKHAHKTSLKKKKKKKKQKLTASFSLVIDCVSSPDSGTDPYFFCDIIKQPQAERKTCANSSSLWKVLTFHQS